MEKIMEKRKFRVMSSVGEGKDTFDGIELNLVLEDDSLGAQCNVLGGKFKITQNGKIFVLVEPEWVLTLMDITPEKVIEWGHMIEDPKELRFNEEIDLFFETKELKVSSSERLYNKAGCTYKALFLALQSEWAMISKVSPEPFPFEYLEEEKIFVFNNEWKFSEFTNITLLREGSFCRKTHDGRFI